MVDPAVLRRFSGSALRYDAHAHAQRLSAADLLRITRQALPASPGCGDTAGEPAPKRGRALKILEPGCGTGIYTRMLLDAFPGSSILGVDISEAMVRVARSRIVDHRARFAVEDAEEATGGTYDLVSSNATFQWFLSFDRTVRRMASMLTAGGALTFSFFGPGTYAELDAAMRESDDGSTGARVAASAFLSREEIASTLSAVFPEWEIEDRRYRQEFPSLAELLKSIRYTGTGGRGAPAAWSPGRLARIERAYRERHGGISATYQVFLCRGSSPEAGER
ncbi:MAG: methyltransferase domain-containing protein [Deltaproteobacteria bacterium]|nr:MAG: methyltransferase domain-containing protein [Deltaproteobacteria bacterium]